MSKRSQEVIPPTDEDPTDNTKVNPATPKKWDESGIQTPHLQNFYPNYPSSYPDYQPSDLRDVYNSARFANGHQGGMGQRDVEQELRNEERNLERVLAPIAGQAERNMAAGAERNLAAGPERKVGVGGKRGQDGIDRRNDLDLYDLANFMNQYDDRELNEYE